MIVGLITGYAVKSLIILSGKLGGGQVVDILTSLLIIPVVIPIVIGALVYFVIANPVVAMMTGLTAWLNSLSDTNAVVLAAILGAMIGVDMGGPITKLPIPLPWVPTLKAHTPSVHGYGRHFHSYHHPGHCPLPGPQ